MFRRDLSGGRRSSLHRNQSILRRNHIGLFNTNIHWDQIQESRRRLTLRNSDVSSRASLLAASTVSLPLNWKWNKRSIKNSNLNTWKSSILYLTVHPCTWEGNSKIWSLSFKTFFAIPFATRTCSWSLAAGRNKWFFLLSETRPRWALIFIYLTTQASAFLTSFCCRWFLRRRCRCS